MFYPCLKTYKAIENPSIGETKQWSTYWLIFSVLKLVDWLYDSIFYWIPLWHIPKCVIIVIMLHPKLRMGEYLYNYGIRPNLNKVTSNVEGMLLNVQSRFDINKQD